MFAIRHSDEPLVKMLQALRAKEGSDCNVTPGGRLEKVKGDVQELQGRQLHVALKGRLPIG